jgi:hypothetical protein
MRTAKMPIAVAAIHLDEHTLSINPVIVKMGSRFIDSQEFNPCHLTWHKRGCERLKGRFSSMDHYVWSEIGGFV